MIKIPNSYECIKQERIEDIRSDAYLLKHKKSGARIALVSNEDENKVFHIAFRTPPADSTGVAHILEHSVLCGSKKFPLKDPFVELVKGSLNTFLNAMTYPDKTIYPVASCNDKDFQNLMDVYLDAVLHPNIYTNPKIFAQEGWHYELADMDAPLKYNGVVYNEMKGAFSSSDDVLERTMMNALFPDTPYGVESGGDPEDIPKLTYDAFLEFHQKYYHPSNSYIYLYGNMDMEEKLRWLDEEYLQEYSAIPVVSDIPLQKPFSAERELQEDYPILEDEPLTENTYLSWSAVVGKAGDIELETAMSILNYVLLAAPGAPLKQALLDAGIGRDIDGGYDSGILQPYFNVIARKAEGEHKDRFIQVIQDTLTKLATDGIDQKALESGLNYYEFLFREANFNRYPKGLILGLGMMQTWLYDENEPFAELKMLSVFEALRKKVPTGYFESVVKQYLIENTHKAVVVLSPKRGLANEKEKRTEDALAAYRATLSEEEKQAVILQTAALKKYQETPDSEEIIRTLPLLELSDVDPKTPVRLHTEEHSAAGIPVLTHDFYTNGIGYLSLLFDVKQVPDALLPYLGLLQSVLGSISTEHFTHGALFHEINAQTGGITHNLNMIPIAGDGHQYRTFYAIDSKYLYPKQDFVFDMIKEILLTSKLDDRKRLREILATERASKEYSLSALGNAAAMLRAESYYLEASAWKERTQGISYLHFIEDLDSNFDEKADALIDALKALMNIIFRKENLTVSLTAEDAGTASILQSVEALGKELYTEPFDAGSFAFSADTKNEGFITAGAVQYVASVDNFMDKGLPYTGALQVLQVLLNYEYLWTNIRVKGGAYGCSSGFSRYGQAYLTSFRDPNLSATLDIYRRIPEYLSQFEADEREMTKYILGAIGNLPEPRSASDRGALSLATYLSGLTIEDIQKTRDEVLHTTVEQIRSFGKYIPPGDKICVVGSEAALKRDEKVMKTLRPLVGGGTKASES